MDQIFISGLQLKAMIGVYPEERLAAQRVVLDIELTVDIRAAANSDDIVDAVDYQQLTQALQHWTLEKHFNLVETLAEYLTEKILQSSLRIQAVRLRLHKFPQDLAVASVGVVVTRSRK